VLPLIVDFTGRKVLVIGGGVIGMRKAKSLVAEGAVVTVLTRELLAEPPHGVAEVIVRSYEPGDLEGFVFVVAATGDGAVNDAIVAEANARATLINVVDDLTRGDTYFAALHRQGDVVVAVSTSGAAPAFAQWIRDEIAKFLPKNLGVAATRLKAERAALHAAGVTTEGRDWSPSIARAVESD
jgi:precorrin-2 dehydrogenase/sirohydrochlorin ferrochelatase